MFVLFFPLTKIGDGRKAKAGKPGQVRRCCARHVGRAEQNPCYHACTVSHPPTAKVTEIVNPLERDDAGACGGSHLHR
jgi:hypothetical protein